MSRAATRARVKKGLARRAREHRHPKPKPAGKTADKVIYGGFVIVGGFVVMLAWLLTNAEYWREALFGYVLVVAWLINQSTYSAYRGSPLPNWKQALARLPLRFVGYGTKEGKPVEAAHGQAGSKKALFMCVVVSVAVMAVLGLILFPEWIRG